MDLILALAVSIGLLGGVSTYLFLTVGTIQIWIAFIAWASFYHCGGGMEGLRKSVVANIWGAIVGFVALLLIMKVTAPLPGVLWPSVVVAITAFVLVLGAKLPALAAIPASVYGYAAIAGYGLLSGADVATFNLANPLVCTVISMVVGALFGIVSEKFAGLMTKSS
ncbi:DUF1097 domain-containing protein [Maritimibacter sp. DP1N21-5]|uniref:DUF1097 domain-containing protein n=1 Tax=Maritimibacter sp. DP1N21-5 TaxID=2836867 RepID=UPI001C471DFB|nr:DUF1097 domain-containing protein [Maritimibacter sp. DP1N21-5]MBV7409296.1 DUF1097 domain-containing protein [Maritimibacter sp. DP1N21-5]